MTKRSLKTNHYVSLGMDSDSNNINKYTSVVKNILKNDITTNEIEMITQMQNQKKKKKNNAPPPLSEAMKLDLDVLKMRNCFNPKVLYTTGDMADLPTSGFQLGEVIPSPLEFHHHLPKKLRGHRLVDELMANKTFVDGISERYLKIKDTNPFTDVKFKVNKKAKKTYEYVKKMESYQKPNWLKYKKVTNEMFISKKNKR